MTRTIWLVLAAVPALAACGSSVVLDGGGGGSDSGGSGTAGHGGGSTSSSGSSTSTGTGGLGPGQCIDDQDCKQSFEYCAPPGQGAGCGICMAPPNPCNVDADCAGLGATGICGSQDCVCGATCVAGCAEDADCGEGEACGVDHHCGPKPCSATPGCPVDFDCAAGVCDRRPCAEDKECTGYCVHGECYAEPGMCVTPAA